MPTQQENLWVLMNSLTQPNMIPGVAAQMATQASNNQVPFYLMPNEAQEAPKNLSTQPQPAVTPVPGPNKKTTATPTFKPLGSAASEIVPNPSVSLETTQKRRVTLPEMIESVYDNYKSRLALTQSEIDNLKSGLAKYAERERGIDFTPLASLVDSLTGSRLFEAARAMAPETDEQRAKNIADMQARIVAAQQNLSEAEKDMIKDKLAQYGHEEQRKLMLRLNDLNNRSRFLDQRDEARKERQTIQYADTVGKSATSLHDNLKYLEDGLGFSIDDIDPKTGKVKGQTVDIEGVSIPLVGRVAITEKAADLQSRFAPIFNTILKSRSGQAVTTQELERLKKEFAQGEFNTEESMLAAVKRFKDAAIKLLKAEESGFTKDIRDRYRYQGGKTVSDLFGDPATSKDASVDDLNADLSKMSADELALWIQRQGG